MGERVMGKRLLSICSMVSAWLLLNGCSKGDRCAEITTRTGVHIATTHVLSDPGRARRHLLLFNVMPNLNVRPQVGMVLEVRSGGRPLTNGTVVRILDENLLVRLASDLAVPVGAEAWLVEKTKVSDKDRVVNGQRKTQDAL